ncbi:hypothetical protein SAMN05428989_2983 [Pseudoxanthomonas sp. GM95]|uniref:hypothetical protein n=1 Tax=Pseudoxanthomonas sp. GM95 TaxID=1881043 RepID=UPI0008B491CD|nr:hypothetical protein [Pseudoxanthomonas sp. GM95]SEM07779.1 hypothetical protein SAMN05428989_2983 [Pseudoxanthomonas sp. GM95]
MKDQQALIAQLARQNRLLKALLATTCIGLAALGLVAAKSPETKAKFTEIDAERINIVMPDGKRELVLANRNRLPRAVIDGREVEDDRGMPGIIFYNAAGDESGGLIFDGKLGKDGAPSAGMHFSMDRFGGDQQLALGHYESGGAMETGLNVYDRGMAKDYEPLWDAYDKAKEGPEKERLRQQWIAAGGQQTPRVFVGKTRGKSSAVMLADAKGQPRIMMLVEPDGTPSLEFLDDKGEVTQRLPQKQAVSR